MLKKRILAFDVGKKRIGVSQSDSLQMIASPIGAFSPGEIPQKVRQWLTEFQYEEIIVGWPLTLKGEEGESVHMVRSFIGELKKLTGEIPIKTLDERFTSTMAHQALRESGQSKKIKKNKGLVDSTAAVILLQEYLNHR